MWHRWWLEMRRGRPWCSIHRTVAVNDRFKGVDIVARSGDPSGNRHSLQIEVVRERYMDEQRFEHNEGYARVRRCLQGLVQMLCENCTDW